MQANRVRYLARVHRYDEALHAYWRLTGDGGRAARLLPEMDRLLVQDAMRYYRAAGLTAGDPRIAPCRRLIGSIAPQPALAPMGRNLDLLLETELDPQSSGTLRAARALLERDGFALDALWWTVLAQYDPHRPLIVPPELLTWRTSVQSLPQAQEDARVRFMQALLALADKDWAGAAAAFERYAGAPIPDGPAHELPCGLAFLRAGREAAALAALEPYARAHPGSMLALELLAEGYLNAGQYAWAAERLDRLHRLQPSIAANLLRRCLLEPGYPGEPFAEACRRIASAEDGRLQGNVPVWAWMASLARDEAGRRAVASAAQTLTTSATLSRQDRMALLEYAVAAGRHDLASPLAAGVPELEAMTSWIALRETSPGASGPRASLSPGLFLTSDRTGHLALTLPPASALLVIWVQGFPVDRVWPVMHLSLGPHGRRTVYLADARTQARPVLLALEKKSNAAQTVDLAVSLLNAGDDGRDGRNILVQSIDVF
jgi:tetratricopeptide (TPR) repeat protein